MIESAFAHSTFAPTAAKRALHFTCQARLRCAQVVVMRATDTGRASLYGGIGILSAVLTNRLVFTPLDSLALTQSRSDIIGVVAGATLVLYGVGRAEILDKKEAVELSGIDVRKGFEGGSNRVTREVELASSALLSSVPNIRSFAVFVGGVGTYFVGRFRNNEVCAVVRENGIIANALNGKERAYLADMKVVPVKEIEFGFLPSNCQVSHSSITPFCWAV